MSDSAGRFQFRVLYRLFLLRVIDLELLSGDGDPTKLLGQFAAMLGGVSILYTAQLILVGGQMPVEDAWIMEHLLIATTMAVVGLFSVLSWDSLVPDRRDVLVLAPLPIATQTLFLAKLAAVGASLGLVILSLNAFSGLLWPLVFSPHGSGLLGAVRSMLAYWVTTVLAAAFTFASVLGVQGLAAQVLSRQRYLRLSALLQVAGFFLFVGLFFLEPSLESRKALTAPENQQLLACLPSYWFMGLFQQLNGSMSEGFAPLAVRAWVGMGITACVSCGVLLLSYFRTLRKLVEQPDIAPASRQLEWLPRIVPSAQNAILLFIVRTLLRSRQHRLIVSFYLGAGGAAVLAYTRLALGASGNVQRLQAEDGRVIVLSASILLMCVAVAGVRIVFAMPIALGANWVFRMTELLEVQAYVHAVRRSLLLISVVPAWLVTSLVLFSIWPAGLATEHLLALALLGGCLAELTLFGFQKIPFTCSYLPGKGNVHFVFWISVILAIPVAYQAAYCEEVMLKTTLRLLLLMAVLGGVWTLAWWRTRAQARVAEGLLFEETAAPAIFGLKLDRGFSSPLH